MKICIHCYISGQVQGVGFRYSAKIQADEYGVTGWVRNLHDGRVEVLICGTIDNVNEFLTWLKKGPFGCGVTEFISTEQPWQEFANFSIISDK